MLLRILRAACANHDLPKIPYDIFVVPKQQTVRYDEKAEPSCTAVSAGVVVRMLLVKREHPHSVIVLEVRAAVDRRSSQNAAQAQETSIYKPLEEQQRYW